VLKLSPYDKQSRDDWMLVATAKCRERRRAGRQARRGSVVAVNRAALDVGGRLGRAAARALVAILMAGVVGCSLVSLKSPEKPLSTRDLNARIATHEFSAHFISAVEQTADDIAARSEDPAVRINALQWKISAAGTSERAASQMAPMMGLLDTWALSLQMHEYLDNGPGRELFGAQQQHARMLGAELSREAEELARRVLVPEEFEHDRGFINDYVHAHPFESLQFARASIVESWTRDSGAQVKLVDSLGTVPEAIANAGDLMRMYGDTVPSQMLWKAQLAAQEYGINGKDVQTALKRVDERISRFSGIADATPGLVNGVVRDVRVRFDASMAQMLGTIHTEGATLSASLTAERQAAVEAVDAERAAIAADATRISGEVVREAGEEARRLVREALLLVIVFSALILGMPFAAGYMVGRARRSRLE